ncbi:ABC transporter ATP-binding protein [Chryseolinea lacunae]|uniref:ABC transporter ATP-binding protein n=1 Tax=Chryseolinea lacunae TaxID=2801331 RepID=A0ABS1KQ30_9BACT|nr:ABC transporter ATP-binding protein [Chryseolinea lacunae]MBL0740797.1 ABC transporter ATP-binding protein [Chryseolinea lacunae]
MQNPYFSLLATAWKYARQERKRFVLVYSCFVMANIVVAASPIFYGWFVNELQTQGVDVLRTGWIYIAFFVGARLLEWAFHGPGRVLERKLAFSVSRNFMEELYHKILHLPMAWHQDHHSGATINKLRKAYEALRDFFQNGFIYFYSFGKFFFSFGAMLYFSPVFGSIGVVLGAITILIIRKFDKPFVATLRQVNEREHEVSSTLFDSLSNIVTVITLRLEKRIQTTFLSKLLAVYPPFKRNVVINEWKWFTAQMMIAIIYGVTTLGYLFQHWNPGEPFMIGGLIILLGYVNQFTSVFNDVAAHYTQIVKYDTDVQNVRDIEKAFDEKHTALAAEPLPDHWRVLDIKHLTFHRGRGVERAPHTGVTNLSLHFPRGQRVALVGESGSGKSTLLALLRGLYTPQEGEVMVNETERISFDTLADTITLLPQDPEIFENTVRYNITLGLAFEEHEVKEACDAAQFSTVIHHLPQGLDTNIMEKGVNLSGGQKQRLALARGVLAARSSNIVLLDEPTSSVDPRTEQTVYRNLFQAFEGKTVISSLHRLHLLSMFDYVYVLKDGVVIDEGTPAYLEQSSTAFRALREQTNHAAPREEAVEED